MRRNRRVTEDIADRFEATVDLAEPASESTGFFGIWRADGIDKGQFLRQIVAGVGGPENVVFSNATGFVLVWTTFARARRLEAWDTVSLVGGVQMDPDRLFDIIGRQ